MSPPPPSRQEPPSPGRGPTGGELSAGSPDREREWEGRLSYVRSDLHPNSPIREDTELGMERGQAGVFLNYRSSGGTHGLPRKSSSCPLHPPGYNLKAGAPK